MSRANRGHRPSPRSVHDLPQYTYTLTLLNIIYRYQLRYCQPKCFVTVFLYCISLFKLCNYNLQKKGNFRNYTETKRLPAGLCIVCHYMREGQEGNVHQKVLFERKVLHKCCLYRRELPVLTLCPNKAQDQSVLTRAASAGKLPFPTPQGCRQPTPQNA